jgi:putative ABC transport system permease protein
MGILALGIGANTAMFTVTNAILFRSLPYVDPSRIVVLNSPATNDNSISNPFFEIVRDRNRSLSKMSLATFEVFNLTGHGDPQQINAARVSWDFFELLGVEPAQGRSFRAEEDQASAAPVVVLSSAFASRLFGNPEQAVGKNITLDTRECTVIAVLPASFTFPLIAKADIWAPRVVDFSLVSPARIARGGLYYLALARLAPGRTPEQAAAEIQRIYQQYAQEQPGNFDASRKMVFYADSIRNQVIGNVRPTLAILSAAVACVLLIACANVAGLLLSRSMGRRKEFAVRAALGASRWTLVRQLLSEGVVLAIPSALVGGVLGIAASRIPSTLTQDVPLDWRVFAFAIAISFLSAILFSFAPALDLSRSELREGLKPPSKHRARGLLVAGQVALSMVLLVACGLLIQSFLRLRNTPLGFDPGQVVTMQLPLPTVKYAKPAQIIDFYNRVLAEIQNIPGAESVAISTALPVLVNHATPMSFEGQPDVPLGQRPIAAIHQISPDYGRVMHVPLLRGREFTKADDERAPKVALINQTVASKFWPNENPIGKKIVLGASTGPFEVVGVWGDTKNLGPASAPYPEVFVPLPQLTAPNFQLSIRAHEGVEPKSLMTAIRARVSQADRDQPITAVQYMSEYIATLNAQPKTILSVLSAFAGVALVLAAAGIYGAITYFTAQKTKELGIRIALGATRGEILRLVIRDGLMLTLVGVLVGGLGSLLLSRFMASLLYETSISDPWAISLSALGFGAIAFIASYFPASKASRIHPADAVKLGANP